MNRPAPTSGPLPPDPMAVYLSAHKRIDALAATAARRAYLEAGGLRPTAARVAELALAAAAGERIAPEAIHRAAAEILMRNAY